MTRKKIPFVLFIYMHLCKSYLHAVYIYIYIYLCINVLK